MKLLLDTVAILRIASDSMQLTSTARELYADTRNELALSVVSLWEMVIKINLGKLPGITSIEDVLNPVRRSRSLAILPLVETSIIKLQSLPMHHRDPFDRMIICQAIDLDYSIITSDAMFRQYDVRVLW